MPDFNYLEWLAVAIGAWVLLCFLTVAVWVGWVALSERRQRRLRGYTPPRHVRFVTMPYNWQDEL